MIFTYPLLQGGGFLPCSDVSNDGYLLQTKAIWDHHSLHLFNNMQTLKFKIQPTTMLFTVINHLSRPLRKQKRLAQWGQKVIFMCCDWQIWIHFVSFCNFSGQPVVAVIMIDSSKTCKFIVSWG